jgi:pimeloyl-ACP methyl ester carboxylesterase
MKKFLKWSAISLISLFVLVGLILAIYTAYIIQSVDMVNMPKNHGKVETKLYLGNGDKQPLVVAFGGGEGGNAWTRQRWQAERDKFIEAGYAFLAVGYFGLPGTPEKLDRIALEGVHAAIVEAAANPAIEKRCIALLGGSKGGELALLLASRYPDIKSVVAIVPASAVFVAITDAMTTSSFSHHGQSLPFVPFPWRATMPLISGDKRKVFDLMSEDKTALDAARIEVEKINGAIFLMSATNDEWWASKEMSDDIMARLKAKQFAHVYEHLAIEGNHAAPFKHLDQARRFLNDNFKREVASGCARG